MEYLNYYTLLNLEKTAGQDEIKQSFRSLALVHHPDKNGNTPESQLLFRSLLEAYQTLSNPELKQQYDDYITTSSVGENTTSSLQNQKERDNEGTLENLKSQMNFILWEVEDLLYLRENSRFKRKISRSSLERALIQILIFMDKKILTPSGLGDHYFSARKITIKEPYTPLSQSMNISHHPYTGIEDYYFQLRKRMNKFIDTIRLSDLNSHLGSVDESLLDCLFETSRFSFYILGSLRKFMDGEAVSLPDYHSPLDE